jgi:hypothetical protein
MVAHLHAEAPRRNGSLALDGEAVLAINELRNHTFTKPPIWQETRYDGVLWMQYFKAR